MAKVCLVVDDVEVSRYSSQIVLEDLGFTVREAADVDSCLKSIATQKPDVILMDWHLRKESGLTAISSIRKIPGADHIAIVVFSGVETANASSEALKAGANGFLVKPTTKDKIEAEFRRLHLL